MKQTLLLVLVTLLLGAELRAQSFSKTVTKQQLLWFALTQTTEFNAKWFLTAEVQERIFINPTSQHQFVTRAHLHYRLGKNWDAGLGFTYFLQSPQDPYSESDLMIPEYRPQLEFNYNQKVNERLQFSHRYKAEWRFFTLVENGELLPETWNYFRFRYRLQAAYKLWARNDGTRAITAKVSDEIMFNAGSEIVYNAFDQNRFSFGLSYLLIPELAVEASYINWFQQRITGNQYYNRNIFQVAFTYTISAKE